MRKQHREKLYIWHVWQDGDFLGWFVLTEAEAYIEKQNLPDGQKLIQVEYFGWA
jgi:hypothetical protein